MNITDRCDIPVSEGGAILPANGPVNGYIYLLFHQ